MLYATIYLLKLYLLAGKLQEHQNILWKVAVPTTKSLKKTKSIFKIASNHQDVAPVEMSSDGQSAFEEKVVNLIF